MRLAGVFTTLANGWPPDVAPTVKQGWLPLWLDVIFCLNKLYLALTPEALIPGGQDGLEKGRIEYVDSAAAQGDRAFVPEFAQQP
jgi:hypothetical protein